jgi:hypothetical protein
LAKNGCEFWPQSISVMPAEIFNMPQNLMTWGRRLYFPSEWSRAADFYHTKKSIVLGQVWTHESCVQWQAR